MVWKDLLDFQNPGGLKLLDLFGDLLIGYKGQILSCTSLNFFAITVAMSVKFALFKIKFVTFRSIRSHRTSLLKFSRNAS